MATMPVVWCTDRNSADDKPTAFALHGIKLEGNVTEKQVLALQNLVAAAAEGRLILPADGTFVLMDSGISLDGTIIDEHKTNDLKPASSIPERKLNSIEDEILYEFLCCAKCLNEKSEKCCYNKFNEAEEALCESKKKYCCMRKNLLQRYFKESCLPSRCAVKHQKTAEVLPEDPLYGIASKYTKRQQRLQRNNSTIKARSTQSRNKINNHRITHNRFSIRTKSNMKKHTEEDEVEDVFDKENIAPVELHCDTKDLISFDEIDAYKVNKVELPVENNDKNNIMDRRNIELDPKSQTTVVVGESPPRSPKSNTSSRKTSFDSNYTISSMDSGFMDMQNRLDVGGIGKGIAKNKLKEKKYAINYKEYLTQSKNRRKSYEEFKAMFNAQQIEVEGGVVGSTKTSSFKRFLLDLVKNEKQNDSDSIILNETSSNDTRSILEEQNEPNDEVRIEQKLDNNIENKKQIVNKHNYNKNNNKQSISNSKKNIYKKPEFENKFEILEVDGSTTTAELHSNATTETMRKNSNFLSLILNQHEVMLAVKEKEKAQIRRKSYEEFKRLVNQETVTEMSNDNKTTTATTFKRQNSRQRKSYASFLLMRRNMENAAKPAVAAVEENQLTQKSHTLLNYKRNFKIYDKLVYGTIYDILQRKNDIYQKYDKYMTYGTIYEILHRKTAQSALSSSQSVNLNANIISHKRKSLSAILERIGRPIEDLNAEKEIEEEKTTATTTTATAVRTYGTIYDILQGDKKQLVANTRFTVSKIDESQVQKAAGAAESSNAESESKDCCEEKKSGEETVNVVIDAKVTKPNKMRRLSNILSYKTNNSNSKENLEKILDNEELYTKVIGLKKEIKALEANPIVKSNSLDAISKKANIITPPDSPSPPRPRRSLKQQSKSQVYGKKFSLENSDVLPQLHKRGLKPPLQRRRWSCAADEEKTKADINKFLEREIEKQTVAVNKKGKSRRLSEFTRGEFLNEKL